MAAEAEELLPWPWPRAPRDPEQLPFYWAALEAAWRWFFDWLRALRYHSRAPEVQITSLLRRFASQGPRWPGLPVRHLRAILRAWGHPARVPNHPEWIEALLRLTAAFPPAQGAAFLVALVSAKRPRQARRLVQGIHRRLRRARRVSNSLE